MASSLCIISLNVWGLHSQDKQLKLFNWLMVNHKADVALLQDTHSTPNDEKQWHEKWQGDIYYSHEQQEARVSHICHNVISDNLGRHVMIYLTACVMMIEDDRCFTATFVHMIG